jgi:hypothetical protein
MRPSRDVVAMRQAVPFKVNRGCWLAQLNLKLLRLAKLVLR